MVSPSESVHLDDIYGGIQLTGFGSEMKPCSVPVGHVFEKGEGVISLIIHTLDQHIINSITSSTYGYLKLSNFSQ